MKGQTIEESLILKDTEDSLYLNTARISFDKIGNYCLELSPPGGKSYFETKQGRSEVFQSINRIYGKSGEISYSFSKEQDKAWYYKNAKSTRICGLARGKLENHLTSNTRDQIGIITSYHDSVFFYLNDQLVCKGTSASYKSTYLGNYEWCAFSENGNAIYFVKPDSVYHLFVNGKEIDQAADKFSELHINDAGTYVYAKGQKPVVKKSSYDYMFFVHTKDTGIGPVRTVWSNTLTADNAYYYSGDDNGTYYIIINNTLQKGITWVSSVLLPGGKKYCYSYGHNDSICINANGKSYTTSFSKIYELNMDKDGHFACYGLKDYYLYKFINGQQSEAITKYGVRPTPLYISPEGVSVHYFKTDDSLYLFRDETLLAQISNQETSLKYESYKDIFPLSGQAESRHSLFYLGYDTMGYWVFNGTFSRPMLPVIKNAKKGTKGEVIAGACTDAGFFVIQRTGKTSCLVNINNVVYRELNYVDNIYDGNCFFDGSELVFYGTRGLSFYRFKIGL